MRSLIYFLRLFQIKLKGNTDFHPENRGLQFKYFLLNMYYSVVLCYKEMSWYFY